MKNYFLNSKSNQSVCRNLQKFSLKSFQLDKVLELLQFTSVILTTASTYSSNTTFSSTSLTRATETREALAESEMIKGRMTRIRVMIKDFRGIQQD